MKQTTVCMVEYVILCKRNVAKHVDIMWSYLEGVEMKDAHEQSKEASKVLGKGYGRSKFV